MNKGVNIQDLGFKDYKETWDYQETLFKETIDIKIKNRRESADLTTPNYLLFVSHPHVYTLGKSGDISNLLLSESQLESKGATFYKINRGGDITYHGPGQVVGYPILDLENFFTDIHKFLRFLEDTIILTLEEYGLKAERSPGETGVWLDVGTPFARKICAMGVRASPLFLFATAPFHKTFIFCFYDESSLFMIKKTARPIALLWRGLPYHSTFGRN